MKKSLLVLCLVLAAVLPACQKCSGDKKEQTVQKPEEAKVETKVYSCSLSAEGVKNVVCVDFSSVSTKAEATEMCGQIQAQYKTEENAAGAFGIVEAPCPAENRVGSCSMHNGLMVLRSYAPVTSADARADCQPDPEDPELNPVFTEN